MSETTKDEPNLIEWLRALADQLDVLISNGVDSATDTARTAMRQAADELEDYEKIMGMMWIANRRGIELFNANHPGSEGTLPDQTKMIEWLVGEVEQLRTREAS